MSIINIFNLIFNLLIGVVLAIGTQTIFNKIKTIIDNHRTNHINKILDKTLSECYTINNNKNVNKRRDTMENL